MGSAAWLAFFLTFLKKRVLYKYLKQKQKEDLKL
jgi:hypothetical protein